MYLNNKFIETKKTTFIFILKKRKKKKKKNIIRFRSQTNEGYPRTEKWEFSQFHHKRAKTAKILKEMRTDLHILDSILSSSPKEMTAARTDLSSKRHSPLKS